MAYMPMRRVDEAAIRAQTMTVGDLVRCRRAIRELPVTTAAQHTFGLRRVHSDHSQSF